MKKAKKVSPKIDNSKEFRHLGVMIGSLGGDVKLVAEQYGDLRSDVKSIKQTVESHTETIGNLAIDMTIVKEDVAVLKQDVSVLKEDVSILKKDMAITKEDIEFIKNNLKKKVDIDEFSALERRVSLLEKHSVKR